MPTVTSPSLNVYSGPNALVDFYDPDKCPPAPLVEVPEHPWREQGVRIYAKLMSALPAANVKSLPALNMLLRARESGELTPETKTIIEYSSGSTVISLGILANIMGIETVKAYLSNKTSPAKLDLLRMIGSTLFAGHAQPEPLDPNGGIYAATKDGQGPGAYNPDQYSNPNASFHIRWTAPQILKQLPDIKVFATCIGTSGTVTGCGLSLKRHKPDITRVGVCTSLNDRIPGPRMYSLLEPVTWFPWREAIDTMMEVSSPEAFEYSLHLCRNGLLVGPSSGMAMLGLFRFLERTMKEKGTLDHLRNEDGEIPCVFICCDGPFQYISEYYDKLPESHFHPIRNSELLGVDSYSYNLDWEMTPAEAHSILFWPKGPSNPSPRVPNDRGKMDFDSSSEVVVLDLRAEGDYKHMKLPNAFNLPIGRTQNPYMHPPTMVEIFKEIDGRVGLGASNDLVRCLDGKVVFTLGYDGHIARLAMSVLRNRGLEAYCIMGGVEEWETLSLAPFGMSN
ncbi:cysteine synthase B [Rhizoctonia solani AG-3 Rhs1AP]|uniref:Cysteine synthase B n=2 Tax=Rhizoctonia solani AG-3 TaxID=1086053 RepID=A0A074RPY0_9AGAM|nr:cysteine synthase B [Rhizoctonia solani AG-3 Rhs1AP]KEP47390.1 cysteine synthase B [Rhizoctonia solani 123E]